MAYFIITSFKKAICEISSSSTAEISHSQIQPDDQEMVRSVKSIHGNKVFCDLSVPNHNTIAARIHMATNNTWKDYRRTTMNAKDMSEITASTPRSDNGKALRKQKLNFRAACLELELYKKCKSYQKLEQKALEQCEQRIRDKALVDQAYEEFLSMETLYQEVTKAYEESKALLEKKDEEHQAALEEKDQELEKLNNEHRSVLTAIHEMHEAKLAEVNRDAAEKRHLLEKRHLEALRALTEVSKKNRCVWENAQNAMEAEGEQMTCEYRDALRENEDEIMRLTNCNHDLKAENNLLVGILTDRPGDELQEHAQHVFAEVQRMKSELEDARADLQVAHIKIENILEAMQQQRDHYESHGDKEQEAQAQLYDLQKKIDEFQEKLAINDHLLRAVDIIPKASNTMESECLSGIASKIQKSDDEVKLLRAENEELRSKANKTDDDNLEISLKCDMMEHEMNLARNKLGVLEAKQSLLLIERNFLADAVAEDDCLTAEDKDLLRRHLRQTREENERLRDRNITVSKENADLQQYINQVQDKAEVKIQQADKAAAYWQTLYWAEAVPKTEALSKEIHELNKELGRDNVHVQERLERNVAVADRNALRFACATTLHGVDTNIIPAEYYEPGFTPGWLPATHDALRLLRPLGWVPVAELDKVWLAPMYRPFTEEDAKQRLEAQGQIVRKQHRKAMGAPPLPGISLDGPSDNAAASDRVETLPPSWVPVCDRTPIPRTPYQEPYAPPYQIEWLKKRANLTREAYNDMDNILKLDVLDMLGIQTESAETSGSPSHIVSYNFEEDPEIF
ncbi:hypothetical protein COCVIDRAFT_105928 [Bipolaris victoriae FI3]|uniref:Uncharacterized protein n=1 Tax=Bipolaris victoriae (strain FI3) TaxID=930091 RepID=W7E271_BIPV3|nr:hypothetical protein COCVIDRAFT_105928 [Bipolaris victoriae FI3]